MAEYRHMVDENWTLYSRKSISISENQNLSREKTVSISEPNGHHHTNGHTEKPIKRPKRHTSYTYSLRRERQRIGSSSTPRKLNIAP